MRLHSCAAAISPGNLRWADANGAEVDSRRWCLFHVGQRAEAFRAARGFGAVRRRPSTQTRASAGPVRSWVVAVRGLGRRRFHVERRRQAWRSRYGSSRSYLRGSTRERQSGLGWSSGQHCHVSALVDPRRVPAMRRAGPPASGCYEGLITSEPPEHVCTGGRAAVAVGRGHRTAIRSAYRLPIIAAVR